MSVNGTVQVEVEPRLLRIGADDVYQLSEIARVSIWQEGRKTPWGRWIGAGFAALVGIVILSTSGGSSDEFGDTSGGSSGGRTAGILILLAAAGYLAWSMYTFFNTEPMNVLIIESGVAYPILFGRDPRAIREIRDLIVDALRNPPSTLRQVTVHGDLIGGNQVFNQRGIGSIGKQTINPIGG